MTPTDNSSLTDTVRQLKEIILSLRGKDHEAYSLIKNMERLVTSIERKSKIKSATLSAAAQGTTVPLGT